MTRECGSCTKCCGWLSGEALGHKFWPGRRCHFVTSKGCSIHEQRPENPCKAFSCIWLGNEKFPRDLDTIPMWMKPDESNVIMIWRENENPDLSFMQLLESGAPMTADTLSWAIQYALNNGLNIFYQVNSGWNKIGNQLFLETEIPSDISSYS